MRLPALLTLLLLTASLHAAVYRGAEFTFRQPDGAPVPVRIWGDEHHARIETRDGWTLVKDAAGRWCYARPGANGIEPSALVFGAVRGVRFVAFLLGGLFSALVLRSTFISLTFHTTGRNNVKISPLAPSTARSIVRRVFSIVTRTAIATYRPLRAAQSSVQSYLLRTVENCRLYSTKLLLAMENNLIRPIWDIIQAYPPSIQANLLLFGYRGDLVQYTACL